MFRTIALSLAAICVASGLLASTLPLRAADHQGNGNGNGNVGTGNGNGNSGNDNGNGNVGSNNGNGNTGNGQGNGNVGNGLGNGGGNGQGGGRGTAAGTGQSAGAEPFRREFVPGLHHHVPPNLKGRHMHTSRTSFDDDSSYEQSLDAILRASGRAAGDAGQC